MAFQPKNQLVQGLLNLPGKTKFRCLLALPAQMIIIAPENFDVNVCTFFDLNTCTK
jgi:hypothetical protein